MTQPSTPEATYYATKTVIEVLILIVSAGNFIYTWWSNREKVTSHRFTALEKEVADRIRKSDLEEARKAHDKRYEEDKAVRDRICAEHKSQTADLAKAYASLHIEVTRLPDRREIATLDETMRELTEKIGTLEGRMGGINRAVDLINQFLIDQGGKR